jgi:hypothetical protein
MKILCVQMETYPQMKKPLLLTLGLLAISSCLLLVIAMIVWINRPSPRVKMQADLAEELGVKINDYPFESAFPIGYFITILQPGMTTDEVHKIVIRYRKVLNCRNISEIYYYFSSDLKDAKRFEIIYDGQGKYIRIEGEEDNSRTLQTFGCEEGVIEK